MEVPNRKSFKTYWGSDRLYLWKRHLVQRHLSFIQKVFFFSPATMHYEVGAYGEL
jgi:hypothetical protein